MLRLALALLNGGELVLFYSFEAGISNVISSFK